MTSERSASGSDTLPPMDKDSLHRIVVQHAKTASLMGVDFVPSFRAQAAAGSGVAAVAAAAPRPERREVEAVADRASPGRPAAAEASSTRAEAPVVDGATRDREAVQAAMDALRARYEREAPHQHFETDHHIIVWGDGDICARLMFVGEAPGEEEDRTGTPFVGRAGQLLNKMIVAMGLSRPEVYIANVLKTRPPNNATPTKEEAQLCAPYLYEQIRIVSPSVIVTLGLPASRCLLGSDESMGNLRGKWHEFTPPGGQGIPLMPTYHPAFLLRAYTPENRAKVWSDLKMVMDRLGLQGKPSAEGGA